MISRMRVDPVSIGWATATLRDLNVPSDEIIVILGTDEPEVVHRSIELHRELLEERLDEQRQALASLERLLVQTIFERRNRTMHRSVSRH